MDAKNVNPLHTTKIVGSYLRHHTVGTSQLPDLITSVHQSLSKLGLPAPVEEVLTPAVSVRQSVRHDYVVCLDLGPMSLYEKGCRGQLYQGSVEVTIEVIDVNEPEGAGLPVDGVAP